MATLTDELRSAAFIVSESNLTRSRGTAVFDSTTDWAGAAIPVGQVYAVVGGVTVAFDGDAVDGSQVAAGILFTEVAAGEDVTRTVINRDAEVTLADLTYDATDTEATDALAAIGIIVR